MIGKHFARGGAAAIVLFALLPYAPGCESRLKPEECDTLRGQAFEILNKAQPCASDADCQQSEWPGCEKPLSKKSADEQIAPLKAKFTEGKCEEKKVECRKPPPVYCKQGLCVHKEAGMPVMDDTPVITP
jgi:hypothetical protein